jgi:hypothetical protein
MTDETMPILRVGAVLGDSDASSMAWGSRIGEISLKVKQLSNGMNSPVRVNVVFHVDGRLAPNEFEGVRTGRFSRAQARLVVQVAVPVGC